VPIVFVRIVYGRIDTTAVNHSLVAPSCSKLHFAHLGVPEPVLAVSRPSLIVVNTAWVDLFRNIENHPYLLTPMSTTNINPRLVFLSFSFSIASGLCFLNSGHTLLHTLGVPGFTTLPPYTSGKIGFVGGVFTALPVLAMRTIPSDLSRSLECPYVVVFFLATVAIGAAQGYVGAKVWKGRIYVVVDNQRLPGVLGVGSASLAGAVGALCLVVTAVGCLVVSTLILAYYFPKDRHPSGRPRPPDPALPEPAQVGQNQRLLYLPSTWHEPLLTFTF